MWVPVPAGPGAHDGSGLSFRAPAEPRVRVGIRVGVPGVQLSSDTGLLLLDPVTGDSLGVTGPGENLTVEAESGALVLSPDPGLGSGPRSVLHLVAAGGEHLSVDGVGFRGSTSLMAVEDSAVTAVNELPLEEYLLGVVPLEIGPRTPQEEAAVEAQAVAARTYAIAHLGAHEEMGFDLYGSVQDQVYGGIDAERPEATRAVRATTGRILTWEGLPIRAYYHSTCGGHTAAVDEVMDREGAPYLQAVEDAAPDGTDWCSISPRYRWSDTWSLDELNGAVLDELARMFGAPAGSIGPIEGVQVQGHTQSGRVRSVAFQGPGTELVLERLDIRFALRDEEGRILGSTDFDVIPTPGGGIEIQGRGYGHGAGMCQWGAIARARAGQSAAEILAAYYPGARLSEVYGSR